MDETLYLSIKRYQSQNAVKDQEGGGGGGRGLKAVLPHVISVGARGLPLPNLTWTWHVGPLISEPSPLEKVKGDKRDKS